MKKKIVLLFSLILALALSIGALAACSNKKDDDVTVSISKTTLDLTKGESKTLTATASDGSEIVWSTSDESVATVSNGKVTGVAAGTATVTATVKDGTAHADCAVTVKNPVTFTFKKGSETITSVEVDRNGDPVTITATASDNSQIVVWSVADTSIASVENGTITGLKEGETTITVQTSTGSATIDLTVVDTYDGVHYQLKPAEQKVDGQWYYYSNSLKGQEISLGKAEVRGNDITFEYSGNCNWDVGDVFLAVNTGTVTDGWHKLSMSINSSVETTITVNGTRVDLEAGDNNVSVAYEQLHASTTTAYIIMGNSEAQTTPKDIKLVISDVVWSNFTQVELSNAMFTVDQDNNVTITDETNAEGVDHYEIGLFKDSGSIVAYFRFRDKTGKLDTSAVEENGTYNLHIRVIGNPGYTSTGWSTGDEGTVTVNNSGIKYDLDPKDTDRHGAGAATAVTSGKWEYYSVTEEGSVCTAADYEDGTVTFEGMVGWTWYGIQLFKHYAVYEAGTALSITLTLEASESGDVTVCGKVVSLVANTPQQVTVQVLQSDDSSTPTITIALSVKKANDNAAGNLPEEGALPNYTTLTFKVSGVSVQEIVRQSLTTPSGSYESENKKITVSGTPEGEEANVAKYEVGFFDGETLKGTASINEDGTFSDLAIKDGTYTLKVRAVASSSDLAWEDSDWSEAVTTEYEVANGGTVEELTHGSETNERGDNSNSIDIPDTWLIWHDGFNGVTTKTLSTTTGSDEVTLTVAYTGAAGNWYGVQLFYKNSSLKAGTTYTITLNIHSASSGKVTLNGTVLDLVAGDNNGLSVTYSEAEGKASFAFQCGIEKPDATFFANGSFVLTGIKWEETNTTKLDTPTIAVDGEKVVTITDTTNDSANVEKYEAGFFAESGEPVIVTVTKGGTLNDSKLEAGNYTLKIRAVSSNLLYSNSEWSEGIPYEKTGGVTYQTYKANYTNTISTYTSESDGNANELKLWWVGDAGWNCGSAVTMSNQSVDSENESLSFTYTGGSVDFCVQVFYDNTNLTVGQKAKLTFKITVTEDKTITVNGQSVSLTANQEKDVEVDIVQGDRDFSNNKNPISSLDVQIPSSTNTVNVTISNIQWTELAD